jgi:glutamate racemase
MKKIQNRPIGIFDSGLGGLTVFKEIRKILPFEDLIYFGDTMRVPYGDKSVENIRKFAAEISVFLSGLGVKMIVVACNTVSANALDVVEKVGGIRVVGVIEPGVKTALKKTKTGKIIVIGTRATVKSHAYRNAIKLISEKILVKEKACPLFVPLVEEGFVNHPATKLIAMEYLSEFRNTDYDTIILGCTHYPLLKKQIREVLGKNISIVDSSRACAKYVKDELIKNNLISKTNRNGKSIFYVSDVQQNFKNLAYRLAGIKICKINIKRF